MRYYKARISDAYGKEGEKFLYLSTTCNNMAEAVSYFSKYGEVLRVVDYTTAIKLEEDEMRRVLYRAGLSADLVTYINEALKSVGYYK